MGAKTGISWTDATWNPIRGCSMAKGSEAKGCLNCYAARLNARGLPGLLSPTTGKPFARILQSGPRWTGEVELIEKALTIPLKWRQPKRIFVNSMSDLFHEALTDEQIDSVFAVMALCPQHTFQVLTKRSERMLAYLNALEWKPRICGSGSNYVHRPGWKAKDPRDFDRVHLVEHWPLPNVWLGVSVEDQATADARIPLLLQTRAAKRFVSYEPALGPVDFTLIRDTQASVIDALRGEWASRQSADFPSLSGHGEAKLDWIIIGGESGPSARPFDVAWARNTIEQCREAGVACFVKQMGARVIDKDFPHDERNLPGDRPGGWKCQGDWTGALGGGPLMHSRAGADPAEWPEWARVQEFPRSVAFGPETA